MPTDRFPREDGFSLIELTVVLLVMAVLMVIGMASYARMAHLADDEAVQLDLVSSGKVQLLHHLEAGVFTSDAAVLEALEPSLQYSVDGADQSVVVEIEDGRAATDVCLFIQSKRGDWFALRQSIDGGARYAETSPIACTPANVAAWSTSPWAG